MDSFPADGSSTAAPTIWTGTLCCSHWRPWKGPLTTVDLFFVPVATTKWSSCLPFFIISQLRVARMRSMLPTSQRRTFGPPSFPAWRGPRSTLKRWPRKPGCPTVRCTTPCGSLEVPRRGRRQKSLISLNKVGVPTRKWMSS